MPIQSKMVPPIANGSLRTITLNFVWAFSESHTPYDPDKSKGTEGTTTHDN
jgi:hypothetical protein